jgi:hypothetical protein
VLISYILLDLFVYLLYINLCLLILLANVDYLNKSELLYRVVIHNLLVHFCRKDLYMNRCFYIEEKCECLKIFDCLIAELCLSGLKTYGKLSACLVIPQNLMGPYAFHIVFNEQYQQ